MVEARQLGHQILMKMILIVFLSVVSVHGLGGDSPDSQTERQSSSRSTSTPSTPSPRIRIRRLYMDNDPIIRRIALQAVEGRNPSTPGLMESLEGVSQEKQRQLEDEWFSKRLPGPLILYKLQQRFPHIRHQVSNPVRSILYIFH